MTTPEAVEAVNVDPTTLVPHPDNARNGDVPKVQKLMAELGWWGAVTVQTSTNRILVGHTRVEAAINLGLATVPVTYRDVDDDQAKLILLGDNRTSDLALYDFPALADLLDSVDASLVEITGWTPDDLDQLLSLNNEEPAFNPNLNPQFEGGKVTDDQVAKEQKRLDERFSEVTMPDRRTEVMCPNCAHTFEVQ